MATREENGRAIKILYPLLIVNLLMLVVLPTYRAAGFIFFVLTIFSIWVFSMPRFQHEVYGVKNLLWTPLLIGGGIGASFLIASAISPFFSILTPTLPQSIGSDVRLFIIIMLAPICEELWRSSMLGSLKDVYRIKEGYANIIQAIIFSFLHLLAYGIFLGGSARWIELYGAVSVISGSFISAGLFGYLSGWIMIKTKNVTPSIFAHMFINAILIMRGFVVVT